MSHYHAIIFGLSPSDIRECQFYKKNKLGDVLYMSRWLQEDVWKNGICTFSDVTWETCAYVARYVQKKLFHGHDILSEYYGAEKEFSVMSRRPGIGAYYFEEHPELWNYSTIYVPGHERGIGVPKYFLDKLELTDPNLAAILKEKRKQYAEDKELLRLQQTDLSAAELNCIEEDLKLSQVSSLVRDL